MLSSHVFRRRGFEHELEHKIVYQVKNENAGWAISVTFGHNYLKDFQEGALHPTLPPQAAYGKGGQGMVGIIDLDFNSVVIIVD